MPRHSSDSAHRDSVTLPTLVVAHIIPAQRAVAGHNLRSLPHMVYIDNTTN